MRRFIVFAAVVLTLLSACQPQSCNKCESDLENCQAFVVYLNCLETTGQDECDEWLCAQFPDAVVCEAE